MSDDKPAVKSYILWYNSKSHGAKSVPPVDSVTRYFVGVQKVSCMTHGFHLKPTWDYDKANATILDGGDGQKTKAFCESGGYTDLILEPIDEQPTLAKPVEEQLH